MSKETSPDIAAADTTDELRQHAKAVREDLGQLGRAATNVAQEKLGEAKQYAGEYLDQGKQKATEIEDQVEAYIRTKPLKSVLIAAGAGALIGYLLGRK
jgi:ElaB/YqjD/DUF883 family membrane-anchored ribosome-binding protein